MKPLRFLYLTVMTAVLALVSVANADDGEKVIKRMTNISNYPEFDQDIVSNAVPETEHAFTGMMEFYVPMQASNGTTDPPTSSGTEQDPREYYNVDEELVETLTVAKPLVNVFIHGPAFEVPDTAFMHSFMDTYASVSLDDGMTWKETNLSLSADLTSFDLETDPKDSVESENGSLPGNHNILLSVTVGDVTYSGYHAPGYDTPYSKECTECHGVGLQGVQQVPSCYSCHASYQVWTEPTPVEIGPIVFSATATQATLDGDDLTLAGVNVSAGTEVTIVNAVTGEPAAATEAVDPLEPMGDLIDHSSGRFGLDAEEFENAAVPCVVAAEYTGTSGEVLVGPAVQVKNEVTGEPIENCAGSPVDLTEYPGGTYNVIHAVEGNKVLVAWPSRFCQQGQPAYSFAWDGDDSDIIANDPVKAEELIAKRTAVAELLGVDVTKDLYLTDLFGVAGSQGSIDFAEEGYPQAGVVPFGCIWTARGVLLPGDDPRTEEVAELSHMVWTKAERLTSGRRDPNRIEVNGVKGAGFQISWQEDPDGLRPGQGEGPGEGWSGAVAHAKTDIWYSFIPWEYFDLVENPEDPAGEPVNIVDHNLDKDDGGSGRPQVYVPMAVPMRLSNNDKCQADYYGPDVTLETTDKKYFSYCNYDVAAAYGLQNLCATTALVPKGQGEDTQYICVNEDGLPNVANTASTRPRASLQGYDSDGDGLTDSAWVILAAEESKGLGRFTFTPDGEVCTELEKDDPAYNPDCVADIGKNQWYFSFDMGDPVTSATADEPNGLVKNLVSQGNMLNQPEVDYRTGEFYPVMNTADMWAFGESGVTDFDMYNTEIARRSSLLVQGISKAMNSSSGLSAILSWKQGAMRQGGPADVMFRRIVVPADYNNTDNCPVVDADKPVITSAVLVKDKDNQWKIEVSGTGTDMDKKTDVLIRGTVSQDVIGLIKDEDGEFGTFSGKINKPDILPCAIQAADDDDDLAYGPWVAIEGAEGQCTGEVPAGCISTGGFVSRGIESNPYAFSNMECDVWLVEPDSNPYYPGGLCGDPATNLSSVVPDTCRDDATEALAPCPAVDFTASTFGIGDTNPILQGYIQGEGNTMRVLTWHQCPSDGVAQSYDEMEGDYFDCSDDTRTDPFVNLKDQSWYNPLDVAKGHRGFLDGDFVMFLYGWSPNWRLNAKGNDRYDLYVRRSFDGGVTWQTTPGSFLASDGLSYSGDGTVTCETYRSTVTGEQGVAEPHVCYDYGAGANEQARNVTQHQRMRITTLDPRYALSGGKRGTSIVEGCVDDTDPTIDTSVMTCDDLSAFDSDLRNPSRYFMVYEVGDNSTVEAGEAEPLDLYYGRAEGFGDDYVVWTETDTGYDDPDTVCYPTVPHDDEKVIGTVIEGSGFCNEFERLNTAGDTHASEASVIGNPDASKLYGVWAQWVLEDDEDYDSENLETDAMARRIWWIDDYRSIDEENIWRLPGTQQPDDASSLQ